MTYRFHEIQNGLSKIGPHFSLLIRRAVELEPPWNKLLLVLQVQEAGIHIIWLYYLAALDRCGTVGRQVGVRAITGDGGHATC